MSRTDNASGGAIDELNARTQVDNAFREAFNLADKLGILVKVNREAQDDIIWYQNAFNLDWKHIELHKADDV